MKLSDAPQSMRAGIIEEDKVGIETEIRKEVEDKSDRSVAVRGETGVYARRVVDPRGRAPTGVTLRFPRYDRSESVPELLPLA